MTLCNRRSSSGWQDEEGLLSDHHDLFLAAVEEPELVDHELDNVLQMRPHGLEFAEVSKLVLEQGWPPTYRKVLAVHAVHLGLLRHPGGRDDDLDDGSFDEYFN